MRVFTGRKFTLRVWPFPHQPTVAQLLVCVTLGLLLSLAFAGKPVNSSPAQPISTTISTTIDATEDAKAMGYPDGRKVARDADGNLYVAYRKKYKQDLRTAYHIFVAKSLDNGVSWSVLNRGRPIESAGDQNQRVPSIAIDHRGTIHVVWYGKDDNGYTNQENQIKYVASTDQGHTWSPWQNLAYVDGYVDQPLWQEHPTLYVDDDDTLYVAWEGRDAWYQDRAQIKFIRSFDGGQHWSLWKNIAPSPSSHSRPTIVGNGRDALYILAYGQIAKQQQIIYSRSTDGGISWSNWAAIAPSRAEQRHVSAVMDSQGQLHVVWRQTSLSLFDQLAQREPKTELKYVTFDGRSWGSPARIPAGQNGAQTFPSIGVVTPERSLSRNREESGRNSTMADDTIWIVWSETMEGYEYPNDTLASGQIYAIAKRAGEWSTPFALASGDHNIYASLARRGGSQTTQPDHDVTGSAMISDTIDVVWLDNQQNLKEIRFAQLVDFGQGAPLATISKTSSTSLFSTQPQQAIVISRIETPYWVHWGVAHFLWTPQLARELQVLILIGIVLMGYILLKFIVTRWFSPLLTRTIER